MKGWELMHMQASYLPWVNISGTGATATELCEHMAREAGVIVGDGTFYVDNGSRFIRLNLGCPRALSSEALLRMEAHQLVR